LAPLQKNLKKVKKDQESYLRFFKIDVDYHHGNSEENNHSYPKPCPSALAFIPNARLALRSCNAAY
jgi:hypothetical protein